LRAGQDQGRHLNFVKPVVVVHFKDRFVGARLTEQRGFTQYLP